MGEIISARGQKLYSIATCIVTELVALKDKSDPLFLRLAVILRDLYDVFLQRRDPSKKLVLIPGTTGFADFKEAVFQLLFPLGFGERMGFYLLSIGRHLLRAVPEAELDGMSFEKVKQLDRVVKAKHEVPAELLTRAKDPELPAARLREEVDIMLYRGLPDHSDGPPACLRLVAGSKMIQAIKKDIERLRPAATGESPIPASDAEVVEYALVDCLNTVQEEEDHEIEQLRHGRGNRPRNPDED